MREPARRFADTLATDVFQQQRNEADDGIDQRQAAKNAAADGQTGTNADNEDRARRGRGIFLREAHETQHQHDHRHSEGRIFRVHEHVPVEGRAQREQENRREAGDRATDAARHAPCHANADNPDDRAEQATGLEQFKRDHLVQQCCDHVEAAAIHVQIGKGQRVGIVKAGAEHLQQQVGIFGVGVIIPAEAVILEGEARDQADHNQHSAGEIVASPLHRAPRGHVDDRRRYR